jgi:hypothetical protein
MNWVEIAAARVDPMAAGHAALLVGAEAVRNVAEDLGDLGQLDLANSVSSPESALCSRGAMKSSTVATSAPPAPFLISLAPSMNRPRSSP